MIHGEIIYTLPAKFTSSSALHGNNGNNTFLSTSQPMNLNYIKTGCRDTKATEEAVMMDSVDSHISSKKTEEKSTTLMNCKMQTALLNRPATACSTPCCSCWLSRKGGGFKKKLLLLISDTMQMSRQRKRNLDYTSPHSPFSVGIIKNLT